MDDNLLRHGDQDRSTTGVDRSSNGFVSPFTSLLSTTPPMSDPLPMLYFEHLDEGDHHRPDTIDDKFTMWPEPHPTKSWPHRTHDDNI